jgi:putative transposase
MKITHQIADPSQYRRALRVLLIGSGGNGSAVLFGLPYLHHALVAWGKTEGIDVTVMDADTVSPTNCVRQPFGAADIGQNKATILVNRINLFHDLRWNSHEELTCPRKYLRSDGTDRRRTQRLLLDRQAPAVFSDHGLQRLAMQTQLRHQQLQAAVLIRTACKLLGVERSSYRYEPRPDRNAELRDELVQLARQKPRYGYRRLHALLNRRGHEVNVKRVYRLYVEEGLMVRRKRRNRLVRERTAEPRLTGANQEWAMDFIVDGLATGRMVRILSVVDVYTRECLALEADTSLGSGRVTRVLERLIGERGRPENVRSDNGPEFTSRRMLAWAEDWKVGLVHIQPGRPMQNGHLESFHGRLRDECLNASWFRTLNDVRCTLAVWREEYNCDRPHSSLDYRTPMEFKLALEGNRAMARLPSPTITSNTTENLQL